VCTPETFSCDGWTKFKAEFDAQTKPLADFKPDLPEFQRCLKREPTKSPADADYARWAESAAGDKIANIASSGFFLRLIKAKIPGGDGKLGENPFYLNPCSYYLERDAAQPPDDELTSLIFFVSEYRCSSGDDPSRMKAGIELSKAMTRKLTESLLRSEGEFSARPMLENEGFSASPTERFADVLGSHAFATYLADIDNTVDRRGIFLASNSWQCKRPSLSRNFPAEDTVQLQYVHDVHTDGEQRRREVLSEPLREALSCKKDFDFKECRLPLVNPSPAK
jgi:hypothetical protein